MKTNKVQYLNIDMNVVGQLNRAQLLRHKKNQL